RRQHLRDSSCFLFPEPRLIFCNGSWRCPHSFNLAGSEEAKRLAHRPATRRLPKIREMRAVGVAVTELTEVGALRRAMAHLVKIAAPLVWLTISCSTAFELMVSPINGTVVALPCALL